MPANRRASGRGRRTAGSSRSKEQRSNELSAGDHLNTRGWLAAIPIVLLTVTTLLPTESIGDDSMCLIVLMWLVGCGCWLYLRLKENRGLVLSRRDLWWCVAAVFLMISAWVTVPLGDARRGLNATFTWSIYPIIFFMVRDVFRDDQEKKAIVAWMMSLAVGLAAYGAYQFFWGMPAVRAAFEQLPAEERAAELLELGISSEPGAPALRHFLDRLRSSEPYATFALTNSLAGFLMSWSLLALPMLIEATFGGNWMPRRARVILWIGAAIVALCLVLTKSRASWLALTCGGVVMSWHVGPPAWKRWMLPVGLAVVALLLISVGVLLGTVDRQVVTETQMSVDYRIQYWQAGMEMVKDHWLLGVGAGNFQAYYSQYKLPAASEQISDPHQFALEIWATLGIVPLLAFLWYLVWRFRVCLALLRGNIPDPETDKVKREKPKDEGQPATIIKAVFGAGIIGCIGTVIIGLPFRQSLETLPNTILPVVWMIVLPVSAVTFFCLQAWVARGAWAGWWCLLAVAALLVNLAAAGGISFPAVAATLWCLLALSDGQSTRSVSPRAFQWTLVGLVLFAAVYVFSSVRPTLERNRHMLDYKFAQSAAEAVTSLNRAAFADRRSPVPVRHLADMTLRRWLDLGKEDGEDDFRKALERMLVADPHSANTRVLAGRMALAAFEATQSDEWIDRAIKEFERARELYPNYAMSHARLAWAYHRKGRAEDAGRAAEKALDLDALHKHEEHKLRQLRVESLGLPTWETPPPGQIAAEQTMWNLRTASQE